MKTEACASAGCMSRLPLVLLGTTGPVPPGSRVGGRDISPQPAPRLGLRAPRQGDQTHKPNLLRGSGTSLSKKPGSRTQRLSGPGASADPSRLGGGRSSPSPRTPRCPWQGLRSSVPAVTARTDRQTSAAPPRVQPWPQEHREGTGTVPVTLTALSSGGFICPILPAQLRLCLHHPRAAPQPRGDSRDHPNPSTGGTVAAPPPCKIAGSNQLL